MSNRKKSLRVLVTGGSGFIGAHLTNNLINLGYKVLNVDILRSQGGIPYVNKKSKFIKGDIINKKTIEKIRKWKPEIIYHLAAETSTYLCEENPEKCFNTNILGSVNLFNYCIKFPPKKFIFTSSMAVYGKKAINVSENAICKPISNYGFSKLFTEKLFQKLNNDKTTIKIFRIFNAYGPYQDFNNKYQGMLSIYLSQIYRKSSVEVTGSLKRSRDFIFIDDIIKVITNNKVLNSKKNIVFNLASGKKTTVIELLNKIFKLTNKKKRILIRNSHKGDTFISYANISLLKKYSIKIRFPITKGIKMMIKDIKRFDENCSYINR